MDAQLVWNTWRRILTNDRLVKFVLHPDNCDDEDSLGLAAEELAILTDYANTPRATSTNIGMYRRGLVRNALAALSYVPLTRHLLYMSGLDVEEVAEGFVQSVDYVDGGPNFWWVAGAFVNYLGSLPEFNAHSKQDVLALDTAMTTLARRLGKFSSAIQRQNNIVSFSETDAQVKTKSTRFVASRAATVSSSRCDLTLWIENPEDFDPDEELEDSTQYWLIYFPTAGAEREYAALSERAAQVFSFLSTPKTVSELSMALDELPVDEVLEIIESLSELGIIFDAGAA